MRTRTNLLAVAGVWACAAALALAGCKDKSKTDNSSGPSPAPPASSSAAPDEDAAPPGPPRYHAHDVTNGHHVTVRVTFTGTRQPPTWTLPPAYESHCGTLQVPSEALVVGDGDAGGNGVTGAVAWLGDVTEGEPPSTETVVQDQKACRFAPHVVAAAVTQTIHLTNSDPANHAVRIDFLGDPPVDELNRVIGAGVGSVLLPKPSWAGRVGKGTCPIHLWMSSWFLFFDHPYFAVTTAGVARLDKVPPGHHELVVWHEGLDVSYDGEIHTSDPVTIRVPIDVDKTDVTRAFTMGDDGALVLVAPTAADH